MGSSDNVESSGAASESDWEDLELGPAGTNPGTKRSQLIGGAEPDLADAADVEVSPHGTGESVAVAFGTDPRVPAAPERPGCQDDDNDAAAEFDSSPATDVLDEEDLLAMAVESVRLGEAELAVADPPQVPGRESQTPADPAAAAAPIPPPEPVAEAPIPAAPEPVAEASIPAAALAPATAGVRSRRKIFVSGLIGAGAIGAVAALVLLGGGSEDDSAQVVGAKAAAAEAGTEATADNGTGAAAEAAAEAAGETGTEAAVEAAGDSGSEAAATDWVIASEPPGAVLFVDGKRVGETPHTLPATSGPHRIAITLGGHALFADELDAAPDGPIRLAPVESMAGRGGIKVRCKEEGRFHVFVDGSDVGQLCPTDRIGVTPGEHTVEIYDLVTGERRSFDADVQKTNRSLRVRVK